ncbi:MAG: DUF2520 domain-containing protein [Parabacteroides sp.]|nr:DUF2520 domain-containing protein [Parabacteroides sp.]
MKIVFIGSGNLATRLSLEMQSKGMEVVQVYSHTESHAERLAKRLACDWTAMPNEIRTDAELYIFSLKDTALEEVISQVKPNQGLWVHTAGSMPMEVFKGHAEHYGVMYPLQTFSRERMVDFQVIPFFIEANTAANESRLKQVAAKLSGDVRLLSSEKRRSLHLAAVFACNFTNHIYTLAAKVLQKQDIPMEVLLPLIDETAAKVHEMSPKQAQTGPAVRYDENVIQKHLSMLEEPEMKALYQMLSQSIHKEHSYE